MHFWNLWVSYNTSVLSEHETPKAREASNPQCVWTFILYWLACLLKLLAQTEKGKRQQRVRPSGVCLRSGK